MFLSSPIHVTTRIESFMLLYWRVLCCSVCFFTRAPPSLYAKARPNEAISCSSLTSTAATINKPSLREYGNSLVLVLAILSSLSTTFHGSQASVRRCCLFSADSLAFFRGFVAANLPVC